MPQEHYMIVRSDNYDRSGERPGFDEFIYDKGPYSEGEAVKVAISSGAAFV